MENPAAFASWLCSHVIVESLVIVEGIFSLANDKKKNVEFMSDTWDGGVDNKSITLSDG